MLRRNSFIFLIMVVGAMALSVFSLQAAEAASVCEYQPDYCYKPTANAGPDQKVKMEEYVLLNGSGSTVVYGDNLLYMWSFENWPGKAAGVPAPAFSDASAVNTSFQATQYGTYLIRLTVYNENYNGEVYKNPGIDYVMVSIDAGPSIVEHQITSGTTYDTTPTLGADNISPIVVYTSRSFSSSGYGPGSIYYQRLTSDGAPSGDPVLVSAGGTDDQLNDIHGGRIVYTAYSAPGSLSGQIMLYDITSSVRTTLATAPAFREARIHGDKVVWSQGILGASTLMLYDIKSEGPPIAIAGPTPTAVYPEIGDRFVVWDQYTNSQRDTYAYDLEKGTTQVVANDPNFDEWMPSTSGPWVVWEVRTPGATATRIEAANLDTGERRVIADNGAASYTPTINGDIIAYESRVEGNFDIYVYQISTRETLRVTTSTADDRLNNVYGDLVAYVDARNGNLDVYVSKFRFVTNTPPMLEPIGSKAVQEGGLLQFSLSATDAEGNALTYSAGDLPTGAAFDAETKTFSWIPTYSQSGSYNVLFTVTDDGSPPASASETVTITVGNSNRSPLLDPIGSKSVNEGQTLSFVVTGSDPDVDNLIYSAANLPTGATFNPATRVFAWTPDHTQAGNYTDVLFTVADNGSPSLSASEAVTITVNNMNHPPVLGPLGAMSTDEGQTLQFTVTATDPDGDALTYSAVNLPPGATFDSATQVFNWTPDYTQSGNYPDIELTVMDNGTPPELDTKLITITVGNVNRIPVFSPVGTQQAQTDRLLQFTVRATDPDGNAVMYSSGLLPAGATFDPGTGTFTWIPAATQVGTYTVTFYATDNGSPSMTARLDVPLVVGGGQTPSEQANAIMAKIYGLGLPKEIVNSYSANVKKVGPFVEAGQVTAAINQLNALVDKVSMDIGQGRIETSAGNDLIGMANDLILQLQQM